MKSVFLAVLFSVAVLASVCTSSISDLGDPTFYSRWLTSLTIVEGGWEDVFCPEGHTKDPVNLNEGTGRSDHIYTCYRQGEVTTPIDDIVVITGLTSDPAACPTGYVFLDHDLNDGAGGRYIYFCYHRGILTPITSLTYKVLEDPLEDPSFPNGTCRTQDLNALAGGSYVYLCFSRDLEVILEVILTDVTYDLSRVPANGTSPVTVASIRFNNTSEGSEVNSLTTSYTVVTSQFWGTTLARGIDMRVIAGVPVFDGAWSVTWTQTHETRTGSSCSNRKQQSCTLSCEAPPGSDVECRASYIRGSVAVPYSATQTVVYVDGREPEVTSVTDVYEGVSASSLEMVNRVVGNFTEA